MSDVSRVRWLCRRGMKELDILLTRYLDIHYLSASVQEQNTFQLLLDLQDPELYFILLKQKQFEDKDIEHVALKIRNATSA